jgi:hypothetical protein
VEIWRWAFFLPAMLFNEIDTPLLIDFATDALNPYGVLPRRINFQSAQRVWCVSRGNCSELHAADFAGAEVSA